MTLTMTEFVIACPLFALLGFCSGMAWMWLEALAR